MAPKFGTSGLRGLVCELTPDLVGGYARAFLAACPIGGTVFVGRDLRESSPRIAAEVIAALRAAGADAVDCGPLPTPALALAAMAAGAAAIMVTGSHIPADRNGLKFYLPAGEITKADEAAISEAFARGASPSPAAPGALTEAPRTGADYGVRYVRAFGPAALAGARIGIYQHSSVARDVMVDVIGALGGVPVPLARSGHFVPVDTEAVDAAKREMLGVNLLPGHITPLRHLRDRRPVEPDRQLLLIAPFKSLDRGFEDCLTTDTNGHSGGLQQEPPIGLWESGRNCRLRRVKRRREGRI